MIKLDRKEEKIILLVFAVIICIITAIRFIVFKPADVKVVKEDSQVESSEAVKEPARIFAYVTGEVKKPGVYELKEGDRVRELVDAAGGFSENADTVSINLAEKLRDEQHINIAGRNTAPEQETQAVKGSISGGKININTATAKELDDFLPGIGEVYANNIVKFRDKNGKFKSINEITRVDGIGEKRFQNIKDLITAN
jgi:competence protein ComEA